IVPEIVRQSTSTPAVEAVLSATLSCGAHATVAPAATYSTGCTAVAVLIWVIAVKEATAVPSTPVACRAMAPEVCGVTRVDAMPFASGRRMQVAAPQTANWTAPAGLGKCTVSPHPHDTPPAHHTLPPNPTAPPPP